MPEFIPNFKVGQRIIGSFFSGVVEHFSCYDYEGSPNVFEQPTTHENWRLGLRLETCVAGRGFEPGQMFYLFRHQFPEMIVKLSSVQDAV